MPRNFVSLFGSGGDVLPVAGGGGALAIENTGSISQNGGSALTIAAFTVALANRLIVGIGRIDFTGTAVASSVVWNTSENLTLVSGTQLYDGHDCGVEIWSLANPTPTTANIQITFAAAYLKAGAGATGFINANAAPFGTPVGNASNTAGGTVSFSSNVGEIGYALIASQNDTDITEGSTLLWEAIAVGADACFGAQWYPGAATINASWSSGIARDFQCVGVSIKP